MLSTNIYQKEENFMLSPSVCHLEVSPEVLWVFMCDGIKPQAVLESVESNGSQRVKHDKDYIIQSLNVTKSINFLSKM
jgi:hypothetical protein